MISVSEWLFEPLVLKILFCQIMPPLLVWQVASREDIWPKEILHHCGNSVCFGFAIFSSFTVVCVTRKERLESQPLNIEHFSPAYMFLLFIKKNIKGKYPPDIYLSVKLALA